MLYVDSHFVIGKNHLVCEDYAWHGCKNDHAYGALADGCSSSPNTDIGARLLVLAARSTVGYPYPVLPEAFGQALRETIHAARILQNAAGLPERALDATLLALHGNSKAVGAVVWGDGYVAGSRVDSCGDVCCEVTYDDNYPFYLNYFGSEERLAQHTAQGRYRSVGTYKGEPTTSQATIAKHDAPAFVFLAPIYDRVAVFSDGVASFTDAHGDPVAPLEIIRELMDFKLPKGRFVVRRMQKFLKEAVSRGWTWADDLSMVAIWRHEG